MDTPTYDTYAGRQLIPGTDQPYYNFTVAVESLTPHSVYVLDSRSFDYKNEQNWTYYETHNIVTNNFSVFPERLLAQMDDGRYHAIDYEYIDLPSGIPSLYMTRTTDSDSAGHVDYIYEVFENAAPPPGVAIDLSFRALDYNTQTGYLDYSYIGYRDGHTESIDYNAVTGQRDYAVTTYLDGRVVAEDYNATTGLLAYVRSIDPNGHTLDQSYDAFGHLDYAVERWDSGRMVVTDYDVAGEFYWSTFTVTYNAAGAVESTFIL